MSKYKLEEIKGLWILEIMALKMPSPKKWLKNAEFRIFR